ncbi:MAG TPA: hypothetical protein PK322_06900 [Opitutaceae bacterium]|nr:hypothetical protein [Opitutaceae bacterium]
MLVSFALRNTVADRRVVPIDCPACGKQNVAAQAQDLRQTLLLFHVLPIFHHRPTLVTCHACGAELVASMKSADLARVGDPQHVARYLRVRLPLVLRALVLGGIVAWLLPLIGTVWTGIAYGWSRRYTGWVRWMALVLFLLSLLPTLGLVLAEAWPDAPPAAAQDAPATLPTRGAPQP